MLLDVGGVLELVDDAAWPLRFRARWAERLGLTEQEYDRRLESANLPDTRVATGVADRFWSGYGAALGATPAQTAELVGDFWDEYCGVVNAELLAALRSLRGAVGLAILSNSGDGAREEEERRFGFASLFDPILYSHEIGVSKPDGRAFAIALAQMDARPHEVLFIDDVDENVESARRLGLHAHLHEDTAGTLAVIAQAVGSAAR
ncbi:hypothetical protein D1781_14045 [Amnibacterium setariae]|uniref:HAD family phosphatase n=1 Tax=Amnibacterium setariae TaxID=2306585 RepID=A0A3A1TYX9_9MICO|nr:hypothetical protein D1781_14045 [Amnibacterium setariae]